MQGTADRAVIREVEIEARRLLQDEESVVPDAVLQTASFLRARGVWFVLSRNREARSCRDAARKRERLGHVGIPLWDEMKSFFGRTAVDNEGDHPRRYIMAHCRGDSQLDLRRLAIAVGATEAPERLSHQDLARFGAEYGLVNPFESTLQPEALDGRIIHAPVLQVFDTDLLSPLGSPGTVMTNAGELTWAVEFHAEDLVAALGATATGPNANGAVVCAEVAVPDPGAPKRPPHLSGRRAIALITGNGPESGIALWSSVNGYVRELLGDENTGDASMPPVRVVSMPELGMTMELDRRAEHVWAKLAPVIDELCRADTALLAIACNTTQFFVDRIRAICHPYGVQFVCLPEVVSAWLKAEEVREVAIVGIPYVADFDRHWSAYEAPFSDFAVEALDDQTFSSLVELAYRVKEEGATEGGLHKLRSILNRGVRSSHVVLALTELSVLFASQRKAGKSGKTLVDPVALYAEALARRWLGLLFPPPAADWLAQVTAFTHPGRCRNPDLGGQPWNEDSLLIGRAVIAEPTPSDAVPTPHQLRQSLPGAGGARDEPLLVAVADGVGGCHAGEKASSFALQRLGSASPRMRDELVANQVLQEISVGLRQAAEAAGDPIDCPRGTTLAGLSILTAGSGDGDREVVWFSVGDCLLLQLQAGQDVNSGETTSMHLVCKPDGDASGGLDRALGAGIPFANRTVQTGVTRIQRDAVFVCCTDGFPASFGILPTDADVAEQLLTHTALGPIWERCVRAPADRTSDRAALGELFDAASRAWPAEGTSDREPDNLTLALVRLRRGGGTAEPE